LEPITVLFIIANLALWVLLIVGGLRVIWFAWIGPRRLDEIERKIDALTKGVETLGVMLDRHIDQR
jgi:hypothetical protein